MITHTQVKASKEFHDVVYTVEESSLETISTLEELIELIKPKGFALIDTGRDSISVSLIDIYADVERDKHHKPFEKMTAEEWSLLNKIWRISTDSLTTIHELECLGNIARKLMQLDPQADPSPTTPPTREATGPGTPKHLATWAPEKKPATHDVDQDTVAEAIHRGRDEPLDIPLNPPPESALPPEKHTRILGKKKKED